MNGSARTRALRGAAIVGGMVLVTSLAACTSGGDSATPESDQKLVIWSDSVFSPALEEAVAAFEEDYGVTVEVQPKEWDSIIGSYEQSVPAGSGPDLSDFNIDHIGRLSDAGLLEPIDLGSKIDDLDPRAAAGWTVDGQLMGLPIAIESTNVWRNTDLFPEAPATWDDVRTKALELQAQGIEYPVILELDGYNFSGVQTAFGGYVFGQNADGSYDVNDVGLDSEGEIAAFTYVQTAIQEGWVKPGVDADVAQEAWANGQVGMHVSGPWMYEVYGALDIPWSVDTIPAGPGGPANPWLSARGLVVNPESPNVALATTFLTDYMASDEAMAAFADASGKITAWLPVVDSTSTEVTAAFTDAMVNALPIPQNAELAGYWTPMIDGLTVVGQLQSTPSDAATNIATQLRDFVATRQ